VARRWLHDATWFQGPAEDFIRVSREGFDRGVSILHFLGEIPSNSRVARNLPNQDDHFAARASSRCALRRHLHWPLLRFFEKRAGRWAISLRQPIYEKDRIDPLDPAAKLQLDPKLLEKFPEGYRHLAYLQTGIGYRSNWTCRA